MKCLKNKRILVTGACGTVGSKLIAALLDVDKYQIAELIGVDNNESELFFMEQQFINDSRVKFYLGDMRDEKRISELVSNIDIVFHVAAFKHVVLCERSPLEAVQTNILGVQNIILAAQNNNIEKVIFTSTDKAVNPTNVMGTSKLMAERLITAANSDLCRTNTIFASTRFGNVLGSNGSVIPIFRKQIEMGGPVTVTDNAMTRFVMSIEESVRLVIESAGLARGGEVFITKMPVLKIEDLAHVMIQELAPVYGFDPNNISIEIIGSKPGEKLYEELMSLEETRRAVELTKYFSVLPAFRNFYADINYDYKDIVSDLVEDPYISSESRMMSRPQILQFLTINGLL